MRMPSLDCKSSWSLWEIVFLHKESIFGEFTLEERWVLHSPGDCKCWYSLCKLKAPKYISVVKYLFQQINDYGAHRNMHLVFASSWCSSPAHSPRKAHGLCSIQTCSPHVLVQSRLIYNKPERGFVGKAPFRWALGQSGHRSQQTAIQRVLRKGCKPQNTSLVQLIAPHPPIFAFTPFPPSSSHTVLFL